MEVALYLGVVPHGNTLSYEELLELARSAQGEVLHTVRGKPFTVGVFYGCPMFTPLSTGQGRSDGRKAAERFLERFNAVGSPMPADYQDVTRNASYFLALIEWGVS